MYVNWQLLITDDNNIDIVHTTTFAASKTAKPKYAKPNVNTMTSLCINSRVHWKQTEILGAGIIRSRISIKRGSAVLILYSANFT